MPYNSAPRLRAYGERILPRPVMLALIREAAAASAALGRQVWIWRTGDGRLNAGLAYRRELGTYVCRCCGRELVR